ncbi:hypothetical protein EI42_05446 [Thermosporothrix hazakensis]|uniref:Uncharacterized protein n=1 Tax=Thermosporothrix hazakensis TaxID=644383 RepID=A0A326TYW2_THEHA|nr:hypothetical protein EI42_05446 [Thermosporothrix hazakensis]
MLFSPFQDACFLALCEEIDELLPHFHRYISFFLLPIDVFLPFFMQKRIV